MTPEAQLIAIAEACGWTDIHYAPEGDLRPSPKPWGKPTGISYSSPLPDYLNDLNAMAQAEQTLVGAQRWHYADLLAAQGDSDASGYYRAATATAAQRAEAFLRTIGKWDDAAKKGTL